MMHPEMIEIKKQILENIKRDIRKKKDRSPSFINIIPDSGFSDNKKLRIEVFVDLSQIYRLHTERPNMFQNLSIENKRDVLNFNNFTISIYKEKVLSNPSSLRSRKKTIKDTRTLVSKKKIENIFDFYRVFTNSEAIASFAFEDKLEDRVAGTQYMYSYKIDFVDKMPSIIYDHKQKLKLMLAEVTRGIDVLNSPASGFLKDPIKGRQVGVLNPYTGKYRLPRHYGGALNSEGFYSRDFINSTKSRMLNFNIYALLALYMDCMGLVHGEKKFAYSTLLKDKSIFKVERNLSLIKNRIFSTLTDTLMIKETNSPRYLHLFLKDCKALLSKMEKMCGQKILHNTVGTIMSNKSINRRIQFEKRFVNSTVDIEEYKLHLPIIYTRLHHQQDLNVKYESLKTLMEHRSGSRADNENLSLAARPKTDMASPIFGLKRCYDLDTGVLYSESKLNKLKTAHMIAHGSSSTSSAATLQQGLSVSSTVVSSGGGY